MMKMKKSVRDVAPDMRKTQKLSRRLGLAVTILGAGAGTTITAQVSPGNLEGTQSLSVKDARTKQPT